MEYQSYNSKLFPFLAPPNHQSYCFSPKQVLERHAIEVKKEQEELNNLKEGSTEKAEKEREFKRNAKIREAEFRDAQKKNNNSDD